MSETLYTRLDIANGAVLFSPVTQPPARVLFGSPVTGKIETGTNIWGGDWFAFIGYAEKYGERDHYHTGCDLNRPNYADAGMPVYASADGEIVFSGIVSGWQGEVIIIEHTLETNKKVWTRYAHIKDTLDLGSVRRGDRIGTIADYIPAGVKGDHHHYDVARKNLKVEPGDWPGTDLARVLSDYYNPVTWHEDHRV